jgi:hypothetical protein
VSADSEESAAVAARDRHDPAAPSSAQPPLPTRRVWPYFVLLVLALCAGGFATWRFFSAPKPTRVLIAIDIEGQWWQGSKAAASFADKLSQKLEKLGFEPVRAGDPGVASTLEKAGSIDAAARKLGASFVLTGTVSVSTNELPVPQKLFEVGLEGNLEVRDVDSSKPLATAPLQSFQTLRERDAAVAQAAGWLVDTVIDAGVPAIMQGERMKGVLSGGNAKLIDKLAPAKMYVLIRNQKKDEVESAYKKLEADRIAEEKLGKLAFLSDERADDRLIATGDKGVLIATAVVDTVYHHEQIEVFRHLQLETLEWKNDAGARAALLWRGYNAFSYPTAAITTPTVGLIEDIYGDARSVTVIVGGNLKRARIEPDLRLSEPHLSPDGSKIAVVERECSGCAPAVIVLDLQHPAAREVARLERTDYERFGGFAWLDDQRLLVSMVPVESDRFHLDDGPRASVWAIDVSTRKGALLFAADDRATSFGKPRASRDGKTLAVVVRSQGADGLAIVDITSKAGRYLNVGGTPDAPAFSHDGKRVAFEYLVKGTRYEEIGMLDVDSGKATRITRNDSPDRYPLFSQDGKRIYFEARNADPVFGRRRAVSRVAWIAAP